jgi:selenocysteine-specific elongation factor
MKGIIGTGGHIDHGKTALIRALTGEETDRLPEERKRGISIDLGFSHLDTSEGRLGVVDVPGHEDFIRNMLAGATGIDVLLLVVAADEGVMPQTREHTAIAGLLGVERAVVALTKVDLVDDDWLALVRDDVADFLAGTPFAAAPVVPTSTVTGEGLDRLRDALEGVAPGPRGRPGDLFRLPVDRAFTVRGTGTVVTGTVWGGRLERDATIRLLPAGPVARVRGLQVHGADVDRVEAGERAAVALTGVDREAVERGMVAVSDAAWVPTHILTVRLRVIPDTDWRLAPRQRVRVHLGTAEVMARAVLLDRRGPVLPGEEAWAQLRLEAPLVARTGDRLVVRSYSPVATIGGGTVVEPVAVRRRRVDRRDAALLDAILTGPPDRAAATLIDAAGPRGVPLASLALRVGGAPADLDPARAAAVEVADRLFSAVAVAAVRDRLTGAVDGHHRDRPLQQGIDAESLRRAAGDAAPPLVAHVLDALLDESVLESRDGRVARAGWTPRLAPEDEVVRDRIVDALTDHGVTPPRLDELAETLGRPHQLDDLVAILEGEGRLVRLEHDLFMEAAALDAAIAAVRRRLAGRVGLSPGDFRDVIGASRRHLMPLLQYLDRAGVTVRSPDGRSVHGP